MDAPDHYQTTYVSKTKIVVFYSLNHGNGLLTNQLTWLFLTCSSFFPWSSFFFFIWSSTKVLSLRTSLTFVSNSANRVYKINVLYHSFYKALTPWSSVILSKIEFIKFSFAIVDRLGSYWRFQLESDSEFEENGNVHVPEMYNVIDYTLTIKIYYGTYK